MTHKTSLCAKHSISRSASMEGNMAVWWGRSRSFLPREGIIAVASGRVKRHFHAIHEEHEAH